MNDEDLENLLSTLDVELETPVICEVESGGRLVLQPKKSIEFHYVVSGAMYLTVSGSRPLMCKTGGLVIVPFGASQTVETHGSSNQDLHEADRCSAASGASDLCDHSDEKSGNLRLLCGSITARSSGAFGLLGRVIEPISGDLSDAPIVRQAFAAMLDEINSPRLGTRAVVDTLMKICLVKTMQSYLDTPGERDLLLASLRAPHIQKVIAEVLAKPEAEYDVQSLANIAGMSRSAFAREFLKIHGMTPMRFVTTVRLNRAAELLRSTEMPIKLIAGTVGFSSRSHFSRAFRDAFGIDPQKFRTAGELCFDYPANWRRHLGRRQPLSTAES